MINEISVEDAKKVVTYDLDKAENGFLIELFKGEDKTEVYLSAAKSGAFKGYHLHRVRAARYICLKGKMKIILYSPVDVDGQTKYTRSEHILDAAKPSRLFIPANVPTGLENIGSEEGWLVNYPDPAYDPKLKDEQVDFTQEEMDRLTIK